MLAQKVLKTMKDLAAFVNFCLPKEDENGNIIDTGAAFVTWLHKENPQLDIQSTEFKFLVADYLINELLGFEHLRSELYGLMLKTAKSKKVRMSPTFDNKEVMYVPSSERAKVKQELPDGTCLIELDFSKKLTYAPKDKLIEV